MSDDSSQHHQRRQFATTHWSLVLLAGSDDESKSREAVNRLCEISWYPVYAFVRKEGRDEEEARDLTQGFFERLIEKKLLSQADQDRGRFRTFLIRSLRNYMTNQWKRGNRQKRGGGTVIESLDALDAEGRFRNEPSNRETPDQLFERRWAKDILGRVMTELGEEFSKAGQRDRFEALKPCLVGDGGRHAAIAKELGLSETAVKTAASRMRARYRELFRQEIGRLGRA